MDSASVTRGRPGLRLRLSHGTGEPPLAEVFAASDALPDDDLAEAIERDGRNRLVAGERLRLGDYIAAIPSLRAKRVALDAAIDMDLRSRCRGSRPTPEAVATLMAEHTDLAGPIRDAAMLAHALWSTNAKPEAASEFADRLPCDFGQPLPDGSAPYRLLRRLGAGSSGEVLLAQDLRLSEPESPAFVAIKVLRKEATDSWGRSLLLDEAAKARRVDHPNVVRTLHSGVTDAGEDYIVHEYVRGMDLDHWAKMRDLPLDPALAASLVERVARAVQAAHTAGLAHCDLKPANVLMTEQDEPKVIDFGVAIRWRESGSGTADSARIGTLAFMAPEQFRREPGAWAPPADVFALGGLLWWLLTGTLPNGSSPEEIACVHDERTGRRAGPSPSSLRAAIDEDLASICARALAPRPGDRTPSAGALADDLRAWRENRPIPWRRPSVTRRVTLWRRRHPVSAIAIVVGAIACVVGTAAYMNLSDIARARAKAAGAAEAQRDIAEKQQRQAAAAAPIVLEFFKKDWDKTWVEQRLAAFQVFETMFGSTIAGLPQVAERFAQMKRDLASEVIDTSRTPSGEPEVGGLIWQTQQAFWLVAKGEADEPRRIVRQALAEWEPRLARDDRWMDALRLLDACCQANTIILVRAGERPPADPAETVRTLQQMAMRFLGRADWGPFRVLALDRLASLLESPAVRDAGGAARAREELRILLEREAGKAKP